MILYKYRISYLPVMQTSWFTDYYGIPYENVISKHGEETGQLLLKLLPGDKIIFEGSNGNIELEVTYKVKTNNPILEFCTHGRDYCTNADGIGEILNNSNSPFPDIGNIFSADIYREVNGSLILVYEVIT